ncbi:glutathione S-transferase, C-terminal domain containing protein [Nitzschia inconspicua]|uniref:Glutathione S-transferase, C-terminal domain containing protein n=1 Tax=Nitzschia inconspicua TaxID=303405 RepID=A0A9K3KQ03_9STRA|nr:glutathione S-transferase, C-terminal domain containing protein [Nitzschia inconspicua]
MGSFKRCRLTSGFWNKNHGYFAIALLVSLHVSVVSVGAFAASRWRSQQLLRSPQARKSLTKRFSFNGGSTGRIPYAPPPPPPGRPQDSRTSNSSSNDTSNSRSSLILYGHPGSRSPLINWAAHELGLDLTMGDLAENPHPFGKIPCLTDKNGEIGIFESGAILQYLQNEYCKSPKLSPGQAAALASWIVWANASLEPICFLSSDDGKIQDTGLRRRNRNDSSGLKDIDRLDEILANVSRQQQRMPPGGNNSGSGTTGAYAPPPSSSLSGPALSSTQSAFLLGKEFTLADVAVASYLLFALRFYPDTDLSRWPNIVKYLYTCANRNAYGRAFGTDVQESLLQLLRGMSGGRDLAGSSLVLYGHPSSTSPTINWAAYEFGLDLVMGNLDENPHPYGRVPCLTDQNGKVMVFDNTAILQYLQDHYKNKKNGRERPNVDGRTTPSSSANESAQIDSWIEWAGTTLEPICLMDGIRDKNRPPSPQRQLQSQQPKPIQRSGRPSPPDPRREIIVDFYERPGIDFEALDELNRILGQRQRQLEQRLQERSQASGGRVVRDVPPSSCFLVGDGLSLADVAVASLLLFIPQNFPGTDLSQWPYLVRYMKDNARRPTYARAFGPEIQAYVLDELENGPRGAGPGPRPPPPPPPRGPSRMGRDPRDEDDRRRNTDRRLFTPAYRT